MKTHDFYYDLPEELIAQTPLERRDGSRLMVLSKNTGEIEHRHFYDLPEYLQPGDTLVLNDSRVLPARLLGHRVPTMGAVEVLLLRDKGDGVWECLTKPGRKTHTGTELSFGDDELTATVVGEVDDGNKLVQFHYKGIFLEVLERLGQMPLPPYIHEQLQDPERYQTVYSRANGSARRADGWAAFHEGASGKVQAQGVNLAYVTLHVGLHVPPGEGGGNHRPSYAQRVLHDERRDGGASQPDAPGGASYRLRRHNLVPDGRVSGRTGRARSAKSPPGPIFSSIRGTSSARSTH